MSSLSSLVQSADVGGYSLPSGVLEAHAVWQRLQQSELPPPRTLHVEDAAGQVVHAVSNGQTPDLLALGAEFGRVQDQRHAYDQAVAVLRLAVEQAGNLAVNTASDAADRIITEHLRPAHEELLARVREMAGLLRPHIGGGYTIDTHSLITANAKVRAAYVELPGLVEKWRVIADAHARANRVGMRIVEHDHEGLFAAFENPMAFFPGWKPPMRGPLIPFPEDATARLLWTVSDEVAPARPWLPTVAEQDAAFWSVFGPHITRINANRHNARAMAEQAVGIERRGGDHTPDLVSPPSSVQRQAAFAGRIFGAETGATE